MSIFNRIYTRLQWGALFLAGFGDRSGLYPLRELWTHHTVMTHLSPNATVAQEMAEMRRIERVGQDRFGRGISYNFVIFPSGRIYMGLGASRIGAHTGGRNSVALSVAFAGNYETNRPTAAALATYADLIRDFHKEGILAAPRTNGGHRDAPGHAGTTACSGRYMQAELAGVNAAAARPAGAAPAAPKPSAPASSGGSTKPWPAGRGPWPDAFLTVSGNRNEYQDRALHKLLGDTPQKWTGNLAQRLQKHLRHHGYYKGSITAQSQIGPQTIRAWQGFLKDRGYYTGSITAQSQWGPQTTRATVNFLNDQAKLYHR